MPMLYLRHFSRDGMLRPSEIKPLPNLLYIKAIFLEKSIICKAPTWKTRRGSTSSVCVAGPVSFSAAHSAGQGQTPDLWGHSWLEGGLPGAAGSQQLQNEPCFLSYYKCFRLVLFVSGAEYQQQRLKWQIIAMERPCVAWNLTKHFITEKPSEPYGTAQLLKDIYSSLSPINSLK